MTNQELLTKILIREFTDSLARNPSYSQRAFAKRLGLSSGAMSSLMGGKRKVSKKLAERITENLALNPVEKEEVLKAFSKSVASQEKDSLQPIERTKEEKRLALEQFEILANPLHFNLLSLLEIEGHRSSKIKMAEKLGVAEIDLENALRRLTGLGLVKKKGRNFVPTEAELASPDEVTSSGIKRHHMESMEEAKRSLLEDPLEFRDFTSQTLAINKSKLKEAKALIRNFGEQLAKLLDEGEKEEVYKINIHLFPVTRLEKK